VNKCETFAAFNIFKNYFIRAILTAEKNLTQVSIYDQKI